MTEKNPLTPEYWMQLMNLARLDTPELKRGWANDTYEEVCWTYYQIRRLAILILESEENLDEENKTNLITRLLRANELSRELIT